MNSKITVQAILLVLLSSLFMSCGAGRKLVDDIHLHKNLQVWQAPELDVTQIRKIAILPFTSHKTAAEEEGSKVPCSFCGLPVQEHKDFSRAGERLAEYLYEEMKRSGPYEIVPLEEVFSDPSLQEEGRDIRFLMEFGVRSGVDAVVVGEVLRIKEREGTDYSVKSPASVAFRLKMVRVRDGMELYRASYDETQRPLSEEPQRLFKWSKVRFHWQTAEQLVRSGIREVAESFPGVTKN